MTNNVCLPKLPDHPSLFTVCWFQLQPSSALLSSARCALHCISILVLTTQDTNQVVWRTFRAFQVVKCLVSLTSLPLHISMPESCILTSLLISGHFLTLTSSNINQYYKFLARRQQGRKWPVSGTNGNDPRPLLVFSTCPYFQQLFTSQLYIVRQLLCPNVSCLSSVQCPPVAQFFL